jgi:ribosomal protein L39E
MTHAEIKALAGNRPIPPWIMKLVNDAIAVAKARGKA